jgi:uncharacterized membrane protein YagU involved in acid resistance
MTFDTHVANWLIWVGLVAGMILANYVSLPVDRIDNQARVWFSSIPCFLIVAFYSPPAAMVLMGIGMTLKEAATCKRCGNSIFQIAGQAGRWMFIALFAAAFVALLAQHTNILLTGVVLCILLWACDVLTAPLVVSMGTVRHTIGVLATRTWMDELMQYLAAYLIALPFFFRDDYVPMVALAATSVLLVALLMALYVGLRTGDLQELRTQDQ